MGVSKARAIQRRRRKELEKTLNLAPAVIGLLVGMPIKKRRKKKSSFVKLLKLLHI